MPVWVTMPPVVARPAACVAVSSALHRVPGPATATRVSRSTSTASMADRSIMRPPSATADPDTP